MLSAYKIRQTCVLIFYSLHHKAPRSGQLFAKTRNSIHPQHSNSSLHPHFKLPVTHPVLLYSRRVFAVQQRRICCPTVGHELHGKTERDERQTKKNNLCFHFFRTEKAFFQPKRPRISAVFCFLKNTYNFFAPHIVFLKYEILTIKQKKSRTLSD